MKAAAAVAVLVGWTLASAPAVAADDAGLKIIGLDRVYTYTLDNFVQNGQSFSVTTPLGSNSEFILGGPPNHWFQGGDLVDHVGQSVITFELASCTIHSWGSDSTTLHFAFTCDRVTVQTAHLSLPPTPTPTPKPTPTPTPTPTPKPVTPVAHPVVKNT